MVNFQIPVKQTNQVPNEGKTQPRNEKTWYKTTNCVPIRRTQIKFLFLILCSLKLKYPWLKKISNWITYLQGISTAVVKMSFAKVFLLRGIFSKDILQWPFFETIRRLTNCSRGRKCWYVSDLILPLSGIGVQMTSWSKSDGCYKGENDIKS